MVQLNDFELGQRVRMTGTVEKTHTNYRRTEFVATGLPVLNLYPKPITYDEGFIVGKRTVQPGKTHISYYNYNSEIIFKPDIGGALTVWLVAFHLRRKPVMCFSNQLIVLTETGDSE